MLDIAALAAFIIYAENNNMNTKEATKCSIRRTFLLDLSKQLYMPAVLERSTNSRVYNNFKNRNAIENVMGSLIRPVIQETLPHPVGPDGRRKFTGYCYICKADPGKHRRKTRKSCSECKRPICDQHTHTIIKCYSCQPVPGPSVRED